MPRETLPGDPTEAGPDTRRSEPPPAWDDWMIYAEEELWQARRLWRAGTREDRLRHIAACDSAIAKLEAAKEVLRG